MNYGTNSDFVPHSPLLSYSNSYALVSPTKEHHQRVENEYVNQTNPQLPLFNSLQKSRSILKNASTLQQTQGPPPIPRIGLSQSADKKQQQQLVRKESLKTVAFGLTTNVDQTVVGKEGKAAAANNNKAKIVIFSHEALSLHKLITNQQEEIDELKKTVQELTTSDEQHRSEAREQMAIIADLSSRLCEVEKRLMGSNQSFGFNDDEKATKKSEQIIVDFDNNENILENGQVQLNVNDENTRQETNWSNEEKENKRKSHNQQQQNPTNNNNGANNKKRMVLNQSGDNPQGNKSSADGLQQRHLLEKNDLPLVRNAIVTNNNQNHRVEDPQLLKSLGLAMRTMPTFKEHVKMMLRVWNEDNSGIQQPQIVQSNRKQVATVAANANPSTRFSPDSDDAYDGGGQSEMRVIRTQTFTHQQELLISGSPGRYNNNRHQHRLQNSPPPVARNARTKPIIQQLSDDDANDAKNRDEEYTERNRRTDTMQPNIRRSDHCTNDAEFFQTEEDDDDDVEEVVYGGGKGNDQQRQRQHQFHNRTCSPMAGGGGHNPFQEGRRQKREANSTIRNRYRMVNHDDY